MRIRIQLITFMHIRLRILPFNLMRNHVDPDPDSQHCLDPDLHQRDADTQNAVGNTVFFRLTARQAARCA
jgi:hypothetical protein